MAWPGLPPPQFCDKTNAAQAGQKRIAREELWHHENDLKANELQTRELSARAHLTTAVDELLLAERCQVVASEVPGTLHRSCSSKAPAATTLAL